MKQNLFKTRFYQLKIHHILFWLCYFVFFNWLSWDNLSVLCNGYKHKLLLINISYLIPETISTYFIIYYLFPKYLYKKRFTGFFLLFLVSIFTSAAFITGGLYLTFQSLPEILSKFFKIEAIVSNSFFGTLFTSIIVMSLKLMQNWLMAENRAVVLEKEKLKEELKFLKAQVNPHFLFNAMNSIYFLIKQNPDLAEETLLKFSDMFRHQLYEFDKELIPLESEINYIKSYIGIEKLRQEENLIVTTKWPENTYSFQIPPLIFMSFVENTFKHVSRSDEQINKIEIDIQVDELGLCTFRAWNSVKKENSSKPKGIGLENIQRRLNLICANKHKLAIDYTPEYFEVILKIWLNEY